MEHISKLELIWEYAGTYSRRMLERIFHYKMQFQASVHLHLLLVYVYSTQSEMENYFQA